MGLFDKSQNEEVRQVSERQKLEGRYASARSDILYVLLFTVLNVILLLTNSDTYFLFSAYIPYLLVGVGMTLCGKFPAEYYEDMGEVFFFDDTLLWITVGIAAVICVSYLLCWLLSKKGRVGWLIFALVMFAIDTLLMLLMDGVSFENIIDVLFHGWVVVTMVMGIVAHFKLKKLPQEVPETFCQDVPGMPVQE